MKIKISLLFIEYEQLGTYKILGTKGDFEGNSDQSHNVEDWTKDRDDPNHSDDEM